MTFGYTREYCGLATSTDVKVSALWGNALGLENDNADLLQRPAASSSANVAGGQKFSNSKTLSPTLSVQAVTLGLSSAVKRIWPGATGATRDGESCYVGNFSSLMQPCIHNMAGRNRREADIFRSSKTAGADAS